MYAFVPDSDDLVSLSEFAVMLDLPLTTVRNWERGRLVGPPFPEPAVRRPRLLLWDRKDLAAWLKAKGFDVPAELKSKGRKRS